MTRTTTPKLASETEINNLLALAREGDEDAFASLIAHTKEKAEKLLNIRFREKLSDIPDALQVADIKAWNHIKQFNGGSQFSTWYIRIAINAMLDNIKRNRKHEAKLELPTYNGGDGNPVGHSYFDLVEQSVDNDQHDYAPSAQEIIINEERLQELRRAIDECSATLKDKYMRVLDLIFVQRKSYKEAADELQIPVGTVMSRLFYTRGRLQKMLKKHKELSLL